MPLLLVSVQFMYTFFYPSAAILVLLPPLPGALVFVVVLIFIVVCLFCLSVCCHTIESTTIGIESVGPEWEGFGGTAVKIHVVS